jgi:hypothetical protein
VAASTQMQAFCARGAVRRVTPVRPKRGLRQWPRLSRFDRCRPAPRPARVA